jgi:hypothetical protein
MANNTCKESISVEALGNDAVHAFIDLILSSTKWLSKKKTKKKKTIFARSLNRTDGKNSTHLMQTSSFRQSINNTIVDMDRVTFPDNICKANMI